MAEVGLLKLGHLCWSTTLRVSSSAPRKGLLDGGGSIRACLPRLGIFMSTSSALHCHAARLIFAFFCHWKRLYPAFLNPKAWGELNACTKQRVDKQGAVPKRAGCRLAIPVKICLAPRMQGPGSPYVDAGSAEAHCRILETMRVRVARVRLLYGTDEFALTSSGLLNENLVEEEIAKRGNICCPLMC